MKINQFESLKMKKILILLFITNSLFAQVQFEAKVSKNSLGLNERLRVDFTMNADGDNFAPPNFESCGFLINTQEHRFKINRDNRITCSYIEKKFLVFKKYTQKRTKAIGNNTNLLKIIKKKIKVIVGNLEILFF